MFLKNAIIWTWSRLTSHHPTLQSIVTAIAGRPVQRG
jgi:hypothetical protein